MLLAMFLLPVLMRLLPSISSPSNNVYSSPLPATHGTGSHNTANKYVSPLSQSSINLTNSNRSSGSGGGGGSGGGSGGYFSTATATSLVGNTSAGSCYISLYDTSTF
jgi:hypothetical protein